MGINWKSFATTVGAVVVGVLAANYVQAMLDKAKTKSE
jgi:hypothetical protein